MPISTIGSLQLTLNSLNRVRLDPILNVLSIPVEPCCLCSDRITALGKSLIKAFGAFLSEEFLYTFQTFQAGEA